jgi:hypothetical protein
MVKYPLIGLRNKVGGQCGTAEGKIGRVPPGKPWVKESRKEYLTFLFSLLPRL